jgi:PAS domain S-box-containing protein
MAKSLKRQLYSALLIPTFVAVALSSVVFIVLEWQLSLRDQAARVQTVAQLLAENTSSALAFSSPDEAKQVLEALRTEENVRDAVLFDRDGKVFASYRSAISTRPLPTAPQPPGLKREPDRLVVYEPVVQGQRFFGTLYLRWDLRPWYTHMRTYMMAALGVLFMSGVLAWILARVLQRRVSEPVLQLAETAATVAEKKSYDARAELTEIAELNVLANAFNHMLETTRTSQEKLAAEAESTRRAEQQLRLVTDATPALIAYVDPETRYHFVNRQFQVWFGQPKETYLGRTMEDVLGAEAFRRLRPYLERAFNGETQVFEIEAPYRFGPVRWVRISYIPHFNGGGKPVGVVILVLDLTERRQIEASLAQAHADLEQYSRTLETKVEERTARLREAVGELEAFSYSIAHDMRAPLRSMQGYSSILLTEHAAQLDPEAQTFLNRIMASARRLDHLIQDVLNYSKLVRQDLPIERVDTQALVQEIITSYPNLHIHQGAIEVVGPLPPVSGSPAALTQVFSNLLGNAVKFVKPGSSPRVRVYSETATQNPEVPAGYVRLWITDEGIGIPLDAQKRLFGMFQRLHRSELYEGTGIGLAIVRKAVERMGGRVGVVSAEGLGSRFWIELKPAAGA